MTAGFTLQLTLDLSGTFVFGLNGALTAMEAEDLDIVGVVVLAVITALVGVVVLAVITALGGGIVRDVLIGSLPPAAFRDWRYLAVAAEPASPPSLPAGSGCACNVRSPSSTLPALRCSA